MCFFACYCISKCAVIINLLLRVPSFEELQERERKSIIQSSQKMSFRDFLVAKESSTAAAQDSEGGPHQGPPSSSSADEESGGLDCAVCLSVFEDSTIVRVTSCGHVFCADCLEAVIAKHAQPSQVACPLCRTALALEPSSCTRGPGSDTTRSQSTTESLDSSPSSAPAAHNVILTQGAVESRP